MTAPDYAAMIPAEAVKAGSDLVLSSGFRLHPDEVLAICAAMLEAWPGAKIPYGTRLILPLPTESANDKG